MASSFSIVGVSSIYQTNPSVELSRRPTATPPLSLPFSNEKSYFHVRLRHGVSSSSPFLASAVVTPNTSVLSEEAFKGIGGLGKDSLNVSDNEYESEVEDDESRAENEDELSVSKLGLPHRLVEALEKRGITQLFPIQVPFFSFILFNYLVQFCFDQ